MTTVQIDQDRRQSLRRKVDSRMRSWNFLRFNAYQSGESLYMAGREEACKHFSEWLFAGGLDKAREYLLERRQYFYDLYNETSVDHFELEKKGLCDSKEYKTAAGLMVKFLAAQVEAEHLLRLVDGPFADQNLPKLIARWTDPKTGKPFVSKI